MCWRRRCRSPVTIQRDSKRARIVLLAAAGRNTRSIAKGVGVQPRIVSHWRRRFADDGLEGLEDKPRPGKGPALQLASTGTWERPRPKSLSAAYDRAWTKTY
jgi:transposase